MNSKTIDNNGKTLALKEKALCGHGPSFTFVDCRYEPIHAQNSLNTRPLSPLFCLCIHDVTIKYHQVSVYAIVYLEKLIKFYGSQLRKKCV